MMAIHEDVAAADSPLEPVAGPDKVKEKTSLERKVRPSRPPHGEVDPDFSAPGDLRERVSWDGQTRRLLERVGQLQSALSCLLAHEDAICRPEGTKPILDQSRAAGHGWFSMSDVLQSAIMGAPQRVESTQKTVLELPPSRAPPIEDRATPLRLSRASPTATPSRKRKPTDAGRDEDAKEARRRGGDDAFKQHEALTPSLCSLLLEALPKVTGVFFDRSQERWVSSVYMGGRNMKSYFPVYKYGFLQARNMAISQRLSQVAHKGVSQKEVDALTPPDLTVDTLLEVLKVRSTENNVLPFLSVGNTALQQKTGWQRSTDDLSMFVRTTRLLQCSKLATKTAAESPRTSICSKSTTSPASRTTPSPCIGAASADGGSSLSGSPSRTVGLPTNLPSVAGGDAASSSSLLSSLHMYAALDFCPWERGVAWGAETFAWAVQQPRGTRNGDGLMHVPVRLAERHRETLEALGSRVARLGDSSKRTKLALELRRVGRLGACKVQQRGALENHQAGSEAEVLVKGEDHREVTPGVGRGQEHVEESRSLASILPLLGENSEGARLQQHQQWDASEGDGERETGEDMVKCKMGADETIVAPEVEAAAVAVFQAVGQAYAKALVLLRRSDEVATDEDMMSPSEECGPSDNVQQKKVSLAEEGGSDGESPLTPFVRNSKEEDTPAPTPFRETTPGGNSVKSSGIAKRALMTRAAVALKPWPQGVSWASSSGRWFAVARLPSGSRVARTFHPSTKGGVQEAYRLASDFLKRIKENPAAVQADLLTSNKQPSSSTRRPLTLCTQHDNELFAALPELQNSSHRTGLYRSSPTQNLTRQLQRQMRPSNFSQHADRLLPVDLEGLAAMEACCRAEVYTPEVISSACSPSGSMGLLLETGSFCNSAGTREGIVPPAEQEKRPKQRERKEGFQEREDGPASGGSIFQSGKIFSSRSTVGECHTLSHTDERLQVDDEEAQILCLQQEAVRRCLLDLRELSASLFAPHICEQKVASVDAHLAFISKSQTFQHVVFYLHLFESALFGGQLPSRMPVETQRVFFGALGALAGALKLPSG